MDLRYVLAQTGIELLAVSETKLSENFPDAQFYVEGLMVFTKKDRITG